MRQGFESGLNSLHFKLGYRKIHEALFAVLDIEDNYVEAPILLLKMNRHLNRINNQIFNALHLFKLAAAFRAYLGISHLSILMNFQSVSFYIVP